MENDIKRTVARMVSDRYEDRLIAELQQLYIRMADLEYMMKEVESGTSCTKVPLSMLSAQHQAMSAYMQLLCARLAVDEIEIQLEA